MILYTDEENNIVESNLLVRVQEIEYLEKLQKGHVYMNKLSSFRKNPNKGIGDLHEGLLCEFSEGIAVVNDIEVADCKNIKVYACDKNPILCFMSVLLKKSGNGYKYIVPKSYLDDFAYDNTKKYGIMIVNKQLLLKRFKEHYEISGIGFCADNVTYTNDFPYLNDIYKVAFRKRKDFSNQNEYRIMLFTEVEDHIEFNIGDISEFSKIFPIEEHKDIEIGAILNE